MSSVTRKPIAEIKRGTLLEHIDWLKAFSQERTNMRVPNAVVTFEEKKNILESLVLEPLRDILLTMLANQSIEGVDTKMNTMKSTLMYQITNAKSVEQDTKPLQLAYDFVVAYLTSFITKDVLPSLQPAKKTKANPNPKAIDLIAQTGICWRVLDILAKTLKFYFNSYVERFVITSPQKIPKLPDKIDLVVNSEFFERIKDTVKQKVSEEINVLREADWARDDTINIKFFDSERYNFLSSVKDLFLKIGGATGKDTYNECIEQAFLTSLKTFYVKKQQTWAATLPVTSSSTDETYLNKTFSALALERQRATRCLSIATIPKLDEILIHCFIGNKIADIGNEVCLTTVFANLFSFEAYDAGGAQGPENGLAFEKLRMLAKNTFEMLTIYDKTQSRDIISKVGKIVSVSGLRDFNALIAKFKLTLDLTKMEKDSREKLYNFFVQFNHVFASYELLSSTVFNQNMIVMKLLAISYGKIANYGSGVTPDPKEYFGKPFCESLAMFMDCNLTKSKLKVVFVSEEVLLKILAFAIYIENKVALFNYIQSQLFYRITDDNYDDLDKERTFNSKLVAHFGLQMTVKVTRLLTSLTESLSFSTKFLEDGNKAVGGPDVYPLILDAGVVVKQKKIEPSESTPQNPNPCFAPFFNSFAVLKSVYQATYSQRKLEVLYSLGTCQLQCTFHHPEKKSYICTSGVLQAIYLSAFDPAMSSHLVDSDGYLRFSDLDNLVKIVDNGTSDIALQAKVIFSLVRSKLLVHKLSPGIEAKEGACPKYTRTCKVRANVEYKNITKKFNIPSFKMEFSEKIDIKEEINTLIDSAVVRIMKSRRRCKVLDLQAEVQQQLLPFYQFNDASMLKKRYESLMEREFIKRDDDDNSMFIYLP